MFTKGAGRNFSRDGLPVIMKEFSGQGASPLRVPMAAYAYDVCNDIHAPIQQRPTYASTHLRAARAHQNNSATGNEL